jgi:LysM repeat protein
VVTHHASRSWSARILAPIVFFAAVTLLVLLVQHSLEDEGTATPTTVAAAPAPPAASTAAPASGKPAKAYYRVRAGDTLESIADRHGTTVPDLLTLNPKIDPLALTPGERIRVR